MVSCQFHLFFKCTKNSLLIACWRLFFYLFFVVIVIVVFYPIHLVQLSGIVFLILFIQPDFSPFLCDLPWFFECALLIFFFSLCTHIFFPSPPTFLSLSDWEALNYVFSSTGFLPIWRELFRKRPTLGHLILNTVFNRSSFGWFISNVCFIFLESYILYLGNGILFCYLYWVSTLA